MSEFRLCRFAESFQCLEVPVKPSVNTDGTEAELQTWDIPLQNHTLSLQKKSAFPPPPIKLLTY